MKHTSFKLIQAVNGGEIREGDNSLLVRKHADGTHQYLVSNDAGVWQGLTVEVADAVTPDPDPITDPVPNPDPLPDPTPTPDPTPANIQNAAELATALSAGSGVYVLAGGDYGRIPSIPDGTTITAADPANRPKFSGFSVNGGADITLNGLHVKYDYTPGDPDHINPCYVTNSARLQLINCLIEGDLDETGTGKGRGLQVWGSNADLLIEDCEFHTWWKGLNVQGDGITMRRCDVHTIRSDGMNTDDANNVLIEGCYFHDFGTAGGSNDHRDMIQFMGASNGVTVQDCFFDINLGVYAQVIWSDGNTPMDNVKILRNTIIASHTNCLAMHSIGTIEAMDNLIVWQPRANEPNNGLQMPKILIKATGATIERNTVPRITLPTGIDALNTIQDGDPDVTRAAARADSRWAHFFGG